MFSENLLQLRKYNKLTQEELAEKIGVSRQAIAKWESGDTLPDLERSCQIANFFNVSLDELVNFNSCAVGIAPPPKGKHIFGMVKVGDKGQIVIPAKARQIFRINPGDDIIVLGDEQQGIALLKASDFLEMANKIQNL